MSLLPIADLIRVVASVHLASYVDSPFKDFGGLMLVGPPATMKSTIIGTLEQFGEAQCLSDVNMETLGKMRDGIAQGTLRTLGLPELQKLYERHSNTASNVEGTLRAMAAEGFRAPSFQDARRATLVAKAAIVAGMTEHTHQQRFNHWEDSGFARRFLWGLVRLDDPAALTQAVVDWERIDVDVPAFPRPPLFSDGEIPNTTTKRERLELVTLLKYQPGGDRSVQAQLLVKILCVLKWWYGKVGYTKQRPMETVHNFASAMSRDGARIVLPRKRRVTP